MKKSLLILLFLGFTGISCYAQQGAAPVSQAAKSSAKYYCPKCMASSDSAATCMKCHLKMVKEGDYYCPSCYASSDKPGQCPVCKKDLVKMNGIKN